MAYFNEFIKLFSLIYPSLLWEKRTNDKVIYLTFDDGPIPEVTDFVLEQLNLFNAKATFFCVGENIQKNEKQFLRIIDAGHSFGNHSYNHLKGWNTDDSVYLDNIEKCQNVISVLMEKLGNKSYSDYQSSKEKKLFRPPYGKIKKSQIAGLSDKYQIVMWKVLSGDFDQNLKPEACLNISIKYSKPGSIIIFHDSLKAEKNLRFVLPRYLEYFSQKGFKFERL